MSEAPEFENFDDFFMFYLSQHSQTSTRRIHAAGTLLGLAIATKAVIKGPRWQVIALPAFGYGASWFSHFVIEKNKPASWGHPVWSLMGDFKMLAGTLLRKDDLMQLGADVYLTEHPEARSAGSSIKPEPIVAEIEVEIEEVVPAQNRGDDQVSSNGAERAAV